MVRHLAVVRTGSARADRLTPISGGGIAACACGLFFVFAFLQETFLPLDVRPRLAQVGFVFIALFAVVDIAPPLVLLHLVGLIRGLLWRHVAVIGDKFLVLNL